jgi:PPOX class probable F420-dependent enzyme
MDQAALRRHFTSSRVAHLATVDHDGRPHVVPIVFALEADTIYFAVDRKPKRTTNLKRLRNIAGNPHVAVLVDHYDDEWTSLWWARADGTASVLDPGPDADRALALLAERYAQYRSQPPAGPVVAIAVERWSGWSFS